VEKPGRPATLSRPSATTVTSPKLTGHAPAGRWIEAKWAAMGHGPPPLHEQGNLC
jgi:hypothetical protein